MLNAPDIQNQLCEDETTKSISSEFERGISVHIDNKIGSNIRYNTNV